MIWRMDHSAPYMQDDHEEGRIWPWIIGVLALIATFLLTAQVSKAIPTAVEANARNAIAVQNISGVNVSVDGRDVSVSGTISTDVDKRSLLASVNSATGVRTVADELTIFDPKLAAEQSATAFESRLESINVNTLAFEQGSASLRPDSQPALDALAELLLSYPDQRIRVSGHTDNTGRPAVNLRISRERADAVVAYLISRGAATSQVIARGFGATSPIADNSTDVGRAKNRRIEIIHIN